MTRKHYLAVSAIIRQHLEADDRPDAVDAIEAMADSLADFFAADNGAFRRDRFLNACGIDA